MIEFRTAAELAVMREAGRVVATALDAVRRRARAGVASADLDGVARGVIEQAGAVPVFPRSRPHTAGTSPCAGVVGVSVNDVIVDGVAGPDRLVEGDLVSIACCAGVDGWYGESAVTFPVGTARREDGVLLETAQQALQDGVAAAVAGNRVGDVSRAVGVVGRSGGYGITTRLGGHGIGRQRFAEPFVPNDGPPGRGAPLRPGMVVTIGPVLLAGGRDSVERGEAGGALHTGDGSRAAHVAHTVAVTDDGPRVLTLR